MKSKLSRKWRILIPLLAAAAGLLVYGLFPLSTRRWDFEFDQEKILYKQKFLSGPPARHLRTEEPPVNILLIIADDLGKTDISLYGGTAVDTPHMDSIGYDGVIFTEAYSTSPICSPSRAGMITGRYQQRYGYEVQPQNRYARNRFEMFVVEHFIDTGGWFLVKNQGTPRKSEVAKQGLPPSEITLGELLGNYGYSTGITGKWHLGFEEDFIPNNRGFDYQYGFYEAFSLFSPVDDPDIVHYRHDYFANKHIWKQERTGSCAIRRNDRIIEEPEYLTFRIAEEANEFLRRRREEPFFLYVPFSAPHTPFQAPREYVDLYSHVEDRNERVYYAMIKALDDAVGSILETLDELGLAENTLLLFASDNGGATYTGATENAPLKGGKFSNFEGGINVPAMARRPGSLPAGEVFDHPVSLLDFFMTAAGTAGVALPEDRVYDGVDLIPYLTGKESGPPHEALYWRAAYNKAVRAGQWKLIIDEKADRTLLYDMATDKIERRNLAAERTEIVAELREKLAAWEKELIEPLWPRVMDFRFIIDGEIYDFAL
ncbi:MAG: sulfatase-like hydrolase/transferase [Spirochaetia bacterium]